MSDPIFGEVIHAYTRAQAIADGTLVDVSEVAREAGFSVPVVLSRTVWEDCVAWDNDAEQHYQDESGRLWDVLFMAGMAARQAQGVDRLTYKVARIPRGAPAGEGSATLTELILHIGPGDAGEPVVTIMYPIDD